MKFVRYLFRIFRRLLAMMLIISASISIASASFTKSCTELALQGVWAPEDTTILLLGAGMDPDGSLHLSSIRRAETAGKLASEMNIGRMIASGGLARKDGPSAAEGMGLIAQGEFQNRLGTKIILEKESLSTLENLLFSLPEGQDAYKIIIVTEGFHLYRAALSYYWAAAVHRIDPPKLGLCHSSAWRESESPLLTNAQILLRESLAFWFNLGRAGIYLMAKREGREQELGQNWLH